MSTLIIKPMDQEAEKRPKLKRGKQMAACSEKVCENHTQNIVGSDMTPDILKGGWNMFQEQESEIFEKNYRDYCDKISEIDLPSISDRIGAIRRNGQVIIPFFDESYSVSKNGIYHSSGKQAEYGICVILSKYILLCPDKPHFDGQWVSFKDFRRVSHFTNVTFFASDVEQIIEKSFSGNLSKLAAACKDLGGTKEDTWSSYDLSFSFRALPRISLLLLFNDGDDEFPAKSTVLFQKHSEYYLDPGSLAMLGAALARKLRKRSK